MKSKHTLKVSGSFMHMVRKSSSFLDKGAIYMDLLFFILNLQRTQQICSGGCPNQTGAYRCDELEELTLRGFQTERIIL